MDSDIKALLVTDVYLMLTNDRPTAGEVGQPGREVRQIRVKVPHSVPAPWWWQQWWWLLWWSDTVQKEVGRVRALLPAMRAGQGRRPLEPRSAPAASCQLSPSVTTAPVSHRSREGITGSDWLKFPRHLAIGCHCAGAPHLLLWKILHNQVSAAISS